MAVIVRTCCCGCDLRTGVIIIALFYMATLSFTIYGNINSINIMKRYRDEVQSAEGIPDSVKQNYNGIINFSYAAAVIHGIQLLVSVLLLIGAINRIRAICLAWIGFTILVILISMAYLIFLVSLWSGFWHGVWIIIAENVLVLYFLIVVYSYAELLKEEEQGISHPAGNFQGQVVTVGYPAGNQPPPAYAKH